MHSFHPSRGRVLFDFLCALGIVASGVGAWKQTGATALLAAAAVAGLYGFVRLFDLIRRDPAEVVEPQRIDFEPDAKVDLPVFNDVVVPIAPVEPVVMAESMVEPAELEELAAPPATKARRAKAPRKANGRKAAKEAKVAEVAPSEPAAVLEFASPDEVEVNDFAASEDMELDDMPSLEEQAHPHIAPLFEPEPFARMPRRAFGRKAG